MLVEWRFVFMECGEQCVRIITGITMMPELCADNWGTMLTQVEVSQFIPMLLGNLWAVKVYSPYIVGVKV